MTIAAKTRGFRATFTASPTELASVRRLVTAHLRSWGFTETVDDAVLATDELFANAVHHGSASQDDTVTVTVDCESRYVRIAVADASPLLPLLPSQREADPMDESGRGLAIVDQICDRWGTEAAGEGPGKRVWCTLRTDRESPPPREMATELGYSPEQRGDSVDLPPTINGSCTLLVVPKG